MLFLKSNRKADLFFTLGIDGYYSITDSLLFLVCTITCYECKFQALVAISSTEFKLVSAITHAKAAKFLTRKLEEYEMPQERPIEIFACSKL